MSKVVEFKLEGNLKQGLRVNLAISTEGEAREVEISGNLPPAPQLEKTYHLWQSNYRSLSQTSRISVKKITYDGSIEKHKSECIELGNQLKEELNKWLNGPEFEPLWRKYLEKIDITETVRILIRTTNQQLRRLPWHLWELLAKYPHAEIALAANDYERVTTNLSLRQQEQISILAILGDSRGINVQQDKQLLQNLLTKVNLTFLCQPKQHEIEEKLFQKKWDILFFAGHSETQGENGRIYINKTDSITLEALDNALKKAVGNGLKLAIFNSCDGLGLARFLSKLNLPQMIVMRELVPDFVAQQFLKDFITSFASGEHFYLAVKFARSRLQGLEREYPGASWLPVIVQNPATIFPTWWSIGGIPPCPYRGLSVFREEDAKFFFGREVITSELVNRVKRDPMVAVIGASGSGKSSLVFAGLIPQLKQQQQVKIVTMRPGNNPFASLATALFTNKTRLFELEAEIDLERETESLSQLIDRFVVQHNKTRFILLIDQFEEIYTLCAREQQQIFLNLLLNAVENSVNFCLVLTLRADFLNYGVDYLRFANALQNATLLLSQMNQTELKQAILKPARLFDVKLQAGLVEQILADLKASPEKLPLLEFALTQLWQKQIDTKLTRSAYEKINGVEGALAQYAEIVYNNLSQFQKKSAQKLFIQLLTIPADGKQVTRRLATNLEVKDWDIVIFLADQRLVVTNRDISTHLKTVEIIHEALIRNWGRLQGWINQDSDFRIWQEQLRQSLRKWEQNKQDLGSLLRGLQLVEANKWLQNRGNDLSEPEAEFIQASLEQEKKDRRQLQIGIAITTTIALVATGLGIFANHQRLEAQKQLFSTISTLTNYSQELFKSNKKFDALIVGLKAGKLFKQVKSEANSDLEIQIKNVLQNAILTVKEKNRLQGHQASVESASFSPDGKLVASASEDRTIKIWDVNTGQKINTLIGHRSGVNSISFSPDGKLLASASEDRTIKIWDVNTGQKINTFIGHRSAVNSISFSPNGKLVASASWDSTIKIWDVNTGQKINTLIGHRSAVNSISFSPDGKLVASASWDSTIKIWDVNTGKIGKEIKDWGSIDSVSFSPDGKTLAFAGEAKKIYLVDVASGRRIKPPLTGHSHRISSVSFNPDGKLLASASWDYTIKLWDVNTGQEINSFEGHGQFVNSVSFSSDSSFLASASEDRTIKLWNIGIRREVNLLTTYKDEVWSMSFSPDGRWLASGSKDTNITLSDLDTGKNKTIKGHHFIRSLSFSPNQNENVLAYGTFRDITLWDVDTQQEIKKIKTGDGWLISISFSPDGKLIAGGQSNNTIGIWDVDTGKKVKTIEGHRDEIWSISFSPDGRWLVSGSDDKSVRIWDVATGQEIYKIKDHKDQVRTVSFSPNGKLLASGSADGTIILTDISENIIFQTVKGHIGKVNSLNFSPDGKWLVSGSDDKSIRIWDVATGKEISKIEGHTAGVARVRFSPDGRWLVSGGADKKVILWDWKILSKFTFDNLLTRGCDWVRGYLKTNPNLTESEKKLCNNADHNLINLPAWFKKKQF